MTIEEKKSVYKGIYGNASSSTGESLKIKLTKFYNLLVGAGLLSEEKKEQLIAKLNKFDVQNRVTNVHLSNMFWALKHLPNSDLLVQTDILMCMMDHEQLACAINDIVNPWPKRPADKDDILIQESNWVRLSQHPYVAGFIIGIYELLREDGVILTNEICDRLFERKPTDEQIKSIYTSFSGSRCYVGFKGLLENLYNALLTEPDQARKTFDRIINGGEVNLDLLLSLGKRGLTAEALSDERKTSFSIVPSLVTVGTGAAFIPTERSPIMPHVPVKIKKSLPIISQWATLLADCETKEKTKAVELIKHFLLKHTGIAQLPLKYTRTDGETLSVLDYASEDADLSKKLKP